MLTLLIDENAAGSMDRFQEKSQGTILLSSVTPRGAGYHLSYCSSILSFPLCDPWRLGKDIVAQFLHVCHLDLGKDVFFSLENCECT